MLVGAEQEAQDGLELGGEGRAQDVDDTEPRSLTLCFALLARRCEGKASRAPYSVILRAAEAAKVACRA